MSFRRAGCPHPAASMGVLSYVDGGLWAGRPLHGLRNALGLIVGADAHIGPRNMRKCPDRRRGDVGIAPYRAYGTPSLFS